MKAKRTKIRIIEMKTTFGRVKARVGVV